jgi:hypothetical protein
MRKVLLIGAAVLALGTAAQAAPGSRHHALKTGHPWFVVKYAQGKCALSDQTPEQVYNLLSTPFAHMSSVSVDRITPDDVTKDDNRDIHVHTTGMRNGGGIVMDFFTSQPECAKFLNDNHVTPQEAAHDDTN